MIKKICNSIHYNIFGNIRQILRFLVVGGTAFFVDYFIYLLTAMFFDILFAKAISFIIATVYTYLLNKLWTFNSKEFQKYEIVKLIIQYTFSMSVNTLVNKIVFIIFEIKIIGVIAATSVCLIINYLGLKYFVFRNR